MTWLERRGLRGVGIGALVDAMRAGRQRGLVGITFDDGYVSVLEAAVPELARHGFGATAYIISDRLGGTNEWDRARPGRCCRPTASASWPRRGSRSARTPPRTCAWPAPARSSCAAEVGQSRASLGALLGTRSADSPTRTARWTRRPGGPSATAGYDYACAVEASMAETGLMALPRIYIGQQDDAARMAAKRLLYRGRIALRGRRP